MKMSLRLALAAGLLLSASSTTSFAFNDNQVGGMAKFYAHNYANAYGGVNVNTEGSSKNCFCKNKNGKIEISNNSEQYNESFSTKSYGSRTVGGHSGARHDLTVKWKGGAQNMSLNSFTEAKGASGFGGYPKVNNW